MIAQEIKRMSKLILSLLLIATGVVCVVGGIVNFVEAWKEGRTPPHGTEGAPTEAAAPDDRAGVAEH